LKIFAILVGIVNLMSMLWNILVETVRVQEGLELWFLMIRVLGLEL